MIDPDDYLARMHLDFAWEGSFDVPHGYNYYGDSMIFRIDLVSPDQFPYIIIDKASEANLRRLSDMAYRINQWVYEDEDGKKFYGTARLVDYPGDFSE